MLVRKLQEDRFLVTSVSSKNTELFLECAFGPLRVRSEITLSLYSWLLFVYMLLGKSMLLPRVWLVLVISTLLM